VTLYEQALSQLVLALLQVKVEGVELVCLSLIVAVTERKANELTTSPACQVEVGSSGVRMSS